MDFSRKELNQILECLTDTIEAGRLQGRWLDNPVIEDLIKIERKVVTELAKN